MALSWRNSFLIVLAVKVVSGCGVARFEVDIGYDCGNLNHKAISASEFPSDFPGTTKLTLGMWFKINLPSTDSFQDPFTLFVLKKDDSSTEPAVYFQSTFPSVYILHVFSGSMTSPIWPQQNGRWYFGIESCNLDSGDKCIFRIVDPTVSTVAALIAFSDLVSFVHTASPYDNSYFLHFGGDSPDYTVSCTSIWKPFMITHYSVPDDSTAISLAFGIVPLSTYNFTLQPYQVYQNLFHFADDTSVLQSSNDPGLFWSTNKQAYPSLPNYSSSQQTFTAIKWPHRFINSNGVISFSMRIKLYLQTSSSDTCSVYWIIRRYNIVGEQIFGFGIRAATGEAVIEFPGDSQTDSVYPFTLGGGIGWRELYLSCQGQWLTRTICTVIKFDNAHLPIVLFLSSTGYSSRESSNDILLLGAGVSPWDPPSATQECGSISIISLAIGLGAGLYPLSNCFGGCLIRAGGPDSECYVQDTPSANVACSSQTYMVSGIRDCNPCPLGCADCVITDSTTYAVQCTSCSQNFTLLSASGICGCIGSYYFNIDPVTNKGQCISKQEISASVKSAKPADLTFNFTTSSNSFCSSSQTDIVLPLIAVYLQGVLLKSNTDYILTSPAADLISVKLVSKAHVAMNSILLLDFTEYNQVEGLPTIMNPSNAIYKFPEIYYYQDPPTIQTLNDMGHYTAIGNAVGMASISSFAILSGGLSGAAVFLLDAIGELEMYKYLNVNFPKNFVAFYEGLYSASVLPNVYSYLNENDSVATSNYYKFQDWETPVLFIERYGDGFIKQNIAFVLAILTWIPYKLCLQNNNRPNKILKGIHYTFRWNMLVSYFIGDFTPFIVQITLQFKEVPFATSDRYTIFSTSVAVIVLVTYVLILGVGIYQINRKRLEVPRYMKQARRKLKEKIEKDKYPESLEVFTESLKDDSLFDKNFLLLTKLEDIILSLNYIFMQEMPLAQCYIYTLVTGFWLLMVLIGKPFTSRSTFLAFVFNGSVKLILGLFAVVLVTNDSADFLTPDMGLLVGSVMIWIVIGTLGINTLFAGFLLLYYIYEVIKKRQERMKKKMAPERQKQKRRASPANESEMALEGPSNSNSTISNVKYSNSELISSNVSFQRTRPTEQLCLD